MFIAAVKITTNYQSVHLFVYKLGTISNAYPTLNNRGHYDVMFFIFLMKASVLVHSKNPGFSP